MEAELLEVPARDQGSHRHSAAHAPVEPGPRPDLAPRVAGDQVLEVLCERGRALHRPVHVLVSEDGAAELHPCVVAVPLFGHRARCSRTASIKASGLATFATCAAPAIST